MALDFDCYSKNQQAKAEIMLPLLKSSSLLVNHECFASPDATILGHKTCLNANV